jgi:hypothetical protein
LRFNPRSAVLNICLKARDSHAKPLDADTGPAGGIFADRSGVKMAFPGMAQLHTWQVI